MGVRQRVNVPAVSRNVTFPEGPSCDSTCSPFAWAPHCPGLWVSAFHWVVEWTVDKGSGVICLVLWEQTWARMVFDGFLEPVGTQTLLPGSRQQVILLRVRCRDFWRRGPASRSPRRHGTSFPPLGGVLLFPYTPRISPQRTVGRRPKAASRIHCCPLPCLLAHQSVWKTQLCQVPWPLHGGLGI